MCIKKLHITIILNLIWSFSFAQQYTNYNVNNGLPSNHVYRITQDYDGFIWFITDKGMVKFNGSEFKKFTIRDGLSTNDIWNIVTTPNGNVWYFSKSPKIGYIKKDSIYAFPSAVNGEILNPLNRSVIGNSIYFSNSFFYYELKNQQWQRKKVYGAHSELKQWRTYLTHSKLDRFYLSKDKKQLIFVDKSNIEIKTIKTNTSIEMSHTRAQINDSIYLWLSDKDYTLLNLNTYLIKTTLFKDAIGVKESKYVRMHLVNNQIQITGKGFVSFLDKEYQLVKTTYIPKELNDHFSFIDKQNNLWIATFTNGVYKLAKSKQNTVYDLINDKVGKIKRINKRILTTVLDKGFYKYDSISKHFKLFQKENDFAYGINYIKGLNKTFFITTKKIITFSDGKKSIWDATSKTYSTNETARQLTYYQGYLYGNFTSGLNKLHPDNFTVEKSYFINGIRTFTSFKDTLIIATSNGLKFLNKDSIIPIKYHLKRPTAIYKKPILCLQKIDATSLLVGTDAYGAFITDLKKIIPLEETAFLSINSVFTTTNNLWLATDDGVYHYVKKEHKYVFINKYSIEDGLLVNNINSVFATQNDLIVSSSNGVVTIPKKKNTNQQLLAIYVSDAKYNNGQFDSKVLFTKDNSINISIATLDFSENASLQYSYKLLPIQNEWTATDSKHLVFSKLSPDSYELQLQSKEKQGKFIFEIKPLWYQGLLAKILFSLLFLSLLIGVILYVRKIELKKQAKKLNAQKKLADFELHALRSQMNPHFVFNSLNAIQYYITKNEIELSEKYLVKFSRLIRMFFDFSREKEITLADEIKLLKGYLEIEKMRFGTDFKYHFIIDKRLNLAQINVPTMLLQPIVENAVNHGIFHQGGKGEICVQINRIADSSFEIIITDDGVGVDKSIEIQNKSLKNNSKNNGARSSQVLSERLYLLNQSKEWSVSYKLTNNKPHGTIVQLTFIKNEKDNSYIN